MPINRSSGNGYTTSVGMQGFGNQLPGSVPPQRTWKPGTVPGSFGRPLNGPWTQADQDAQNAEREAALSTQNQRAMEALQLEGSRLGVQDKKWAFDLGNQLLGNSNNYSEAGADGHWFVGKRPGESGPAAARGGGGNGGGGGLPIDLGAILSKLPPPREVPAPLPPREPPPNPIANAGAQPNLQALLALKGLTNGRR